MGIVNRVVKRLQVMKAHCQSRFDCEAKKEDGKYNLCKYDDLCRELDIHLMEMDESQMEITASSITADLRAMGIK